MRDKIFEMHGLLSEFCAKVDDHHGALFGNGQPGLKERLNTVEVSQKSCPARLAAYKDKRMFYIAAAGVCVSFIAVIVQAFRG